jgi:NADP-dependent 3-hydroxy acid dehydrogenase YdfG
VVDAIDRVIWITGASGGIGTAIARAGSRHFRVGLIGRTERPLLELAEQLGGPSRALPLTCDVSDFSQVAGAVQRTLARFGRIDVVVANAGIGAPRGFTRGTPERWREMVATNVLGTAYTVRATMDQLRANKGHLVLMSSIAGRKPLAGSLYSATKHAVSAMGECVRAELDGSGVRVTTVEPGTVDTPYFETPPEVALDPADVAEAVMFAISRPAGVDFSSLFLRPTDQPT